MSASRFFSFITSKNKSTSFKALQFYKKKRKSSCGSCFFSKGTGHHAFHRRQPKPPEPRGQRLARLSFLALAQPARSLRGTAEFAG